MWHWKLTGGGEWGLIAQRGLPPLPPRAKTETRAEQYRMAGECLCGARGGKLRSFCNALMRLIKYQCLVGSRNRTTLENGSVVLALKPRNLPRNCEGLAASDSAPPDFCEQTEAVTWLRFGLMNFSPYKPSFSDIEVVCETTCGLLCHRTASDWEVRQRPSFLRQYADGLVWSSVHTLVLRIPARRSATKRSVGHKRRGASAVLDSVRKADPSATGRGRGRGDVEIESVSSEGDKMVDAAADLEIEEMGFCYSVQQSA